MISARDCETWLGVLEIENEKLRVLQGYVNAYYAGDLDYR